MRTALFVVLMLLSTQVLARDPAQVRAFRKENACPATKQKTGPCPGWVVDHMIPLCAGGPDTPDNMMWQRQKESYRKDKHERALCARMKKCAATS